MIELTKQQQKEIAEVEEEVAISMLTVLYYTYKDIKSTDLIYGAMYRGRYTLVVGNPIQKIVSTRLESIPDFMSRFFGQTVANILGIK